MARGIAALAARAPAHAATMVVDPFAGSGNTLFWITRHVAARHSIGFEVDERVYATSQRNLAILNADITLVQTDYAAGLATLTIPDDQLLIVFIAPPWGDALSETSGLDVRRT